MTQKPAPLQAGQYYHLHSRGINRENIFREERNYSYFLHLYTRHFSPVADTFAYCLMRNHFHFLVRIKTDDELLKNSGGFKTPGVPDVSQHFCNFLNAYAKAINKSYNRTGSLFQNRFGREVIKTDAYFLTLITYIHRNPQHHRFEDDFRNWPYSSYPTLISTVETRLCRHEVISWFGSQKMFIEFHMKDQDNSSITQFIMNDADDDNIPQPDPRGF